VADLELPPCLFELLADLVSAAGLGLQLQAQGACLLPQVFDLQLPLRTDLVERLLRVLHELIVGNRRLQLGRAAARLARRVQRVRRALLPRAAAPGGGPGARAQALSQGRAGAAGGGGCAGPHQQPALLRHGLRGELLQRRDRVEARLRLPTA